MIDPRQQMLRGRVAADLARIVTRGAHELLATAYAEAIKRNAKLRARFRRRAKRWEHWSAWPKRPHPDKNLRESWGYDFARGQLPRCGIGGRLLFIGTVDATPEQTKEIEYQIESHHGDLPCCVCPSDTIISCLTHWELYHAGAARCFRCERHPAARRGTMPGVVCGPLWEGRKTAGFVMAPSPAPPPPPMLVLG